MYKLKFPFFSEKRLCTCQAHRQHMEGSHENAPTINNIYVCASDPYRARAYHKSQAHKAASLIVISSTSQSDRNRNYHTTRWQVKFSIAHHFHWNLFMQQKRATFPVRFSLIGDLTLAEFGNLNCVIQLHSERCTNPAIKFDWQVRRQDFYNHKLAFYNEILQNNQWRRT